MAASKTSKRTAKKGDNYPPNDSVRRERTRKADSCQLCGTKVALKEQYTVENDLKATPPKVIRKKNAARGGAEKMSHYCADCADKRVRQKAAWVKTTYGEVDAPKSNVGSGTASSSAAKPKPKTAKKAGRRSGKAKASSSGSSNKTTASEAKAAAKEADPF